MPHRSALFCPRKVEHRVFDRFQDQKTLQMLSALTTDRTLILGHVLIGAAGKSHEIPAAQQLIDELGLTGRLFTLDALHGQKNR